MGQNNKYSVGKCGLIKGCSETPVFGAQADFLGEGDFREGFVELVFQLWLQDCK